MKTKFLFLGLFFLVMGSVVNAQSWQAGTETLYTNPTTTKVGIGTTTPYTLLSLGSTTANTKFALWDHSTGRIGFGVQPNKFILHLDHSGNDFCFYSDDQLTNEIFRIKGNGNVGIGTTSPDSKLEVDGKITCEEVEVKNVSADYVFEKGYKLRTLREVEAFINNNGHLPDVAPATETAKGVNLSEFNSLLLQKIEELTVYAIEQEKRLNAQQKKIEELQNSILNQQ